ncbi:MAG: hypothetical protein QM601_07605 [Pseudoxanthomonas sp.]
MSIDQTDFDRRMRHAHAVSLQSLPPTALARLRAARNEARSEARRRLPLRWRWLAAAVPAVLAVAIGLQLAPGHRNAQVAPLATSVPAATQATSTTTASAAADSSIDPLTENPDFYAWLGSDAGATLQ